MQAYPGNIQLWFTHKTRPDNPVEDSTFNEIHSKAREFAEYLQTVLPADRQETILAFQHLEELVYWCNTSISRS
jgi:hypothetical protein